MFHSLASVILLVAAFVPANGLTVLADGKSMKYGQLSNGLKWQSSGVLTQGCPQNVKGSIKDCYGLQLTSKTSQQLEPGTTRQRIEFVTGKQTPGRLYTYQWKQFLAQGTSTSSQFFHLMQVFDDSSARVPIVTLDAKNGRIVIVDFARSDCGGKGCPSASLNAYLGKTTIHRLKLVSGPKGTMSYTVTDANSGKTIISYDVKGKFGTDATYVKFGAYRAVYNGMSAINAGVGDYSRPN